MSKLSDDYIHNCIMIYEKAILESYQESVVNNSAIKFTRNQIDIMKELLEYRKTGLTPEQIIEMDKLYSEMAKELGEYKKLAGDDLK